jgi:hypothetical protein
MWDDDSMMQNNEDPKRMVEVASVPNDVSCKWQKSELGPSNEFAATHLRGFNEKVGYCNALLNLLEIAFGQRQLNEKG